MKPLLISTSDLDGGAARAAYRLHKGLIKANVNSKMMVRAKLSRDETVISHKPFIARLGSKLDGQLLYLYPKRQGAMFSPQWFPDSIAFRVKQLNPDLVHLHWTCNGYLSIETLAKLNKPLVWTLHDMWAFTGGCHYTQECDRYTKGCGACPQLGSDKVQDLSHQVWQRKVKAWRNLDLTIVAPSKWMAQCVSNSQLFEHCQVKVIPYGLETQIYKPTDKLIARNALGLPHDKKLVLFGAGSTSSDQRKGFQFLIAALQRLDPLTWSEQLELAIFGESANNNSLPVQFKSHYLGYLTEDTALALAYAAADVFVAPSKEDNLPNTVLEALSCGTPCLAFNIGGMPDMIDPKQNGYLAQPFDVEELATGMKWILEDETRRAQLSINARKKVVETFSEEEQVANLVSLYKTILSKTPSGEQKYVSAH